MLDVPGTNCTHYNERFTILEHIKLVKRAKVDQSCKTVELPETGEGKRKQRYEESLCVLFY
jgi:hypothetical protein